MTTLIQRPLRGSRISSFYPVKSLPSLSSLDSAFQLQEYISLLIRLDVHDVDAIVSIPGSGRSSFNSDKSSESLSGEKEQNEPGTEGAEGGIADEKEKMEAKVTVDEPCWIYEQLRRLAQDLSHPLITMLQQECTRSTCPEMKAGEWLYLCVAHGNDGAMEQCCAIDYILHTIDSATALLNSPRAFPSRLQIPQTSHRHFSSLARRLGRIFAHAYFHHREAFEQAEAESSLYARFLALTSKFELVPQEFLVIPPRAVNMSGEDDERGGGVGRGEGDVGRGRDGQVSPPKLMGAGLGLASSSADTSSVSDPSASGSGSDSAANLSFDSQLQQLQQPAADRAKSTSPGPGSGGESPRKVGRNRTDTMVFSDAHNFVEELARASSGGSSAFAGSSSSNAGSGADGGGEKVDQGTNDEKKDEAGEESTGDAPTEATEASTASVEEPESTSAALDDSSIKEEPLDSSASDKSSETAVETEEAPTSSESQSDSAPTEPEPEPASSSAEEEPPAVNLEADIADATGEPEPVAAETESDITAAVSDSNEDVQVDTETKAEQEPVGEQDEGREPSEKAETEASEKKEEAPTSEAEPASAPTAETSSPSDPTEEVKGDPDDAITANEEATESSPDADTKDADKPSA